MNRKGTLDVQVHTPPQGRATVLLCFRNVPVQLLRTDQGVATSVEPRAALHIAWMFFSKALACWWQRHVGGGRRDV